MCSDLCYGWFAMAKVRNEEVPFVGIVRVEPDKRIYDVAKEAPDEGIWQRLHNEFVGECFRHEPEVAGARNDAGSCLTKMTRHMFSNF